MATDFFTRSGGGRYQFTLETDRLEHFEFVQAVARICVDGKRAALAPVMHGRWLEFWPGISLIMTGEEMLWRCSACDAKYPDVEGYKFCPNCGAVMDAKDGASDG